MAPHSINADPYHCIHHSVISIHTDLVWHAELEEVEPVGVPLGDDVAQGLQVLHLPRILLLQPVQSNYVFFMLNCGA